MPKLLLLDEPLAGLGEGLGLGLGLRIQLVPPPPHPPYMSHAQP